MINGFFQYYAWKLRKKKIKKIENEQVMTFFKPFGRSVATV